MKEKYIAGTLAKVNSFFHFFIFSFIIYYLFYLCQFLDFYEALLRCKGEGHFIAGKDITFADFTLWGIFLWLFLIEIYLRIINKKCLTSHMCCPQAVSQNIRTFPNITSELLSDPILRRIFSIMFYSNFCILMLAIYVSSGRRPESVNNSPYGV